ncbi:MFS transporter [Cellulomonas sp. GbtcB1]|uniref:MFS transporter n=1 Tax=Cellulomonas sp. GbtcB1 TaxID=2824746 RepID=UPI001C301DC9|nr:MFS transporter [Cellulomonas sp. GbtcB1]
MPLPILALALTAFALGTAEFVPNGLLPLISSDLDISVARAGLVTTTFALGAMLGGPVVAAATLKVPRRPLVLVLTAVFLVANALTSLTHSLAVIGVLRALAGAMLGGFLGTAITMSTGLVAAQRRATAIAVVFTGLTASNVVAVPIGNILGRAIGWQAAFWVISALAALGLVAMALVVPRARPGEQEHGDSGLGVLRNGRLWVSFLAIALGYGGLFVAFTYIAPFLTDVSGIASGSVTWVLLLFGVGLIGGNVLGGHLADRSITAAVLLFLIVLIVGLVALWALGPVATAVMVLLVVVGAAGFGMVPPLQSYVLQVAGTASAVVSALAAASFNAGVAVGSGVGGAFLEQVAAYRLLPLVGAAMTVLGLAIFLLTRRSHAPAPTPETPEEALVSLP